METRLYTSDMRKLQTAIFLLVSSFVIAQTAQPAPPVQQKSTQKIPTKSDPQGYSQDVLDDGTKVKTQLGHPATYAAPNGSADKKMPSDLQEIITAQFGKDFTIAAAKSNGLKYLKPEADTWVPFLTADLDGDGVEDAIIVARCKKPLVGQVDFHYTVVDPYFTANGFGDPKITASMNSDDPMQNFL